MSQQLRAIGAFVLASGLHSCGGDDGRAASCRELLTNSERYLDVRGSPTTVPEDDSLFTIVLTNSSDDRAEVDVATASDILLTVGLPASQGCGHQPVYFVGTKLEPGPQTLDVEVDDSEVIDVEVRVVNRPQWLVIQVQEGFPTEPTLHRTRPAFG